MHVIFSLYKFIHEYSLVKIIWIYSIYISEMSRKCFMTKENSKRNDSLLKVEVLMKIVIVVKMLMIVKDCSASSQGNHRKRSKQWQIRSRSEEVELMVVVVTAIIKSCTYHNFLVYGDGIYDCTLTFTGSVMVGGK